MDSFIKESDIRRPNMKETRREDGNLQCKKLNALLKRVKKMELQGQKKDEELKTLKKIQKVKAILEQTKKMDKSQQHMEYLHGLVGTGKATEDIYYEMCDVKFMIREKKREYH